MRPPLDLHGEVEVEGLSPVPVVAVQLFLRQNQTWLEAFVTSRIFKQRDVHRTIHFQKVEAAIVIESIDHAAVTDVGGLIILRNVMKVN